MDSLNYQFIYAILIIGLGFVLRQVNIIKERDGETLARIVFNLTLPALIVVAFHEINFTWSLLLLIIIGFGYGILSALLGVLVFRNQPRTIKGMLVMMVPGLNVGLFAYPLVEGIWGKQGIEHFGMLDAGNAFIVFGLCYFIGSYYSAEHVKLDVRTIFTKMTRSIPFMTYLAVSIINLIGLRLPVVIIDVSEIIAVANMPMALLLLGVYMSFKFDRKNMALIAKLLSLRYITGLTVGGILFAVLPYDDMVKFTLLVGLILPISVSALPYSVEFNYNARFVGTVSNLSIIISFFLLWIIGNTMM